MARTTFDKLELQIRFWVPSDTPAHWGMMTFMKDGASTALVLSPEPYAGEHRRFTPTQVVYPDNRPSAL
jgi:hypothetical protein